jgi:hypothetical protein
MKIDIKAEMNLPDILAFFTEQLKNSGIDAAGGNFKIHAFSEKKSEWVEVKDIKIIFDK